MQVLQEQHCTCRMHPADEGGPSMVLLCALVILRVNSRQPHDPELGALCPGSETLWHGSELCFQGPVSSTNSPLVPGVGAGKSSSPEQLGSNLLPGLHVLLHNFTWQQVHQRL